MQRFLQLFSVFWQKIPDFRPDFRLSNVKCFCFPVQLCCDFHQQRIQIVLIPRIQRIKFLKYWHKFSFSCFVGSNSFVFHSAQIQLFPIWGFRKKKCFFFGIRHKKVTIAMCFSPSVFEIEIQSHWHKQQCLPSTTEPSGQMGFEAFPYTLKTLFLISIPPLKQLNNFIYC